MRTFSFLLAAGVAALAAGAGAQLPPAARSARDLARAERAERAAAASLAERPALPPAPWAQGDPADSLYSAGRAALRRNNWRGAASIFRQISERYPRSAYVNESLYWQAFALRNTRRNEDLKTALEALKTLEGRDPKAMAVRDAPALKTQICGELARQGDQPCAASIVSTAQGDDSATRGRSGARSSAQQATSCPSGGDDDERMMALNALLQMDPDQAMPILKRLLERRETCYAPLRRKAVWLISQKGGREAADLLLRTAQEDPDRETREQALFWMGQVDDPRVVDLLAGILRSSTADEGMKNRAIHALSQHNNPRGQQMLREFAEREGESSDLRQQAIFWLGQSSNRENTTFLRGLYGKVKDEDLKEKIMFSLSQQQNAGNEAWLTSILENGRESVEIRKKALFHLGQMSTVSLDDLLAAYGRMTDQELKEQFIWVLSMRSERAAVDKLMEIARTEKDRSLKQKAIFWLGQSRDPRVAKFLEELISKP
jgi:HEAT repeat protein